MWCCFTGEVISNPGSGGVQHIKPTGEDMDRQLIKSMNDCPEVVDYLYKPPISPFTLNFTSQRLESDYRRHYLDDSSTKSVPTLALPRVSSLLDMIVSMIFFGVITLCCFIGFSESIRPVWIVVFIVAGVVQVVVLIPMLCDVCAVQHGAVLPGVGRFLSNWYPRHALGAVVASLPTIAVYATFSCVMFETLHDTDFAFCLFVVTTLLHYCNFTMLSSWMKSALATATGVLLLILLGARVCSDEGYNNPTATGENITDTVVNATGKPINPDIFFGEHQLRFEVGIKKITLFKDYTQDRVTSDKVFSCDICCHFCGEVTA